MGMGSRAEAAWAEGKHSLFSTWAFGLTRKFGSDFSVYFYFGRLLLGTEVLPQN
jgi:hypothetical protein